MQFPSIRTVKIGVIAAAILVVVGSAGVHFTSKNYFCLSCHEMRVYQVEQSVSPHAKDAKGNEIGCSQCHIPSTNVVRMLGAKAWMGLLDLWMHTFYGDESLNRVQMQPVARRFTDDANCRACHKDLALNAKGDAPNSPEGLLAHDNYQGKNGQSRNGCVGCHHNLAHLPVFDARIPSNKAFALKIKEMRENRP